MSTNSLGPFSEADLKEIEKSIGEGFTHIVIPANRNWEALKRRFQFDCRIHLSRLRQPLRDLRWPILKDSLQAIVQMDEIWLEKFSPKDLRHALLLPPSVFATNATTKNSWQYCDAYSMANFGRAEKLLKDVEQQHRRPDGQGSRSWVDHRNRRYRFDPSMH